MSTYSAVTYCNWLETHAVLDLQWSYTTNAKRT